MARAVLLMFEPVFRRNCLGRDAGLDPVFAARTERETARAAGLAGREHGKNGCALGIRGQGRAAGRRAG